MESLPTNQPYQPQLTTHLIVRLPAAQLTEVTKYINAKTLKYLCGQHEPDDEDKLVHCHFMLCDLQVSSEALRKTLIKHDISGAKYSWLMTRPKGKGVYDWNHLGTYIMKGGKTTVFTSSFDEDKVTTWVETWEIPHARTMKNQKDVDTKSKKPHDVILEIFLEDYDLTTRPNLDTIRTWTMAYYWRTEGWMPHATVYKRSAVSLFIKHVEIYSKNDKSSFERALDELKELWY